MMTMIISGSDGVTFPDSTNQFSGGAFSFKNRIINGDMRISQRGTSFSVSAGDALGNLYTLDRWIGRNNTDGVFSVAQDSSAATGFNNSAKITATTADASIGAAQSAHFNQRIEGFNVADLGYGAAGAKTTTLSFWVRSSLTGTFAGSLLNSDGSRNYVFTYSISVADTWEYKTVTITGDTSGTWQKTASTGLDIRFSLAAGSNYNGTAGSWTSSDHRSVSGAVQVIGTLNATWFITGVQLEVGSVATPFERRPFGAELMLCQRYYYKNLNSSGNTLNFCTLQAFASDGVYGKLFDFPVQMRATPSITASGTFQPRKADSSSAGSSLGTTLRATTNLVEVNGGQTGLSGLVAGNASSVTFTDGSFIALSAEL